MNYRGRPYLPPNCPIRKLFSSEGDAPEGRYVNGDQGDVDFLNANMGVTVMDASHGNGGSRVSVEVGFYNDPSDPIAPYATTGSADVDIKPGMALQNTGFLPTAVLGVVAEDGLRDRLCDRINMCHGIVDGQCWAIGSSAVNEVVTDMLNGGS